MQHILGHGSLVRCSLGVQECEGRARGTLLGLTACAIDTTPWKYLIAKLKEALDQVQLLSGLLPICASCKRIKDEHEVWQPLEVYIQAHSEAKFTHGVCPDCLRKLYPEYFPQ